MKRSIQDFINKRMCISNIQQLNKNSIEFFLSTQTRRIYKLSRCCVTQVEC